jgi:hypothetical protein
LDTFGLRLGGALLFAPTFRANVFAANFFRPKPCADVISLYRTRRASVVNPEDSNTPKFLCIKRRSDIFDIPERWFSAIFSGEKFAMTATTESILIHGPMALHHSETGVDMLFPVLLDCDATVAKTRIGLLHRGLIKTVTRRIIKPFICILFPTCKE